MSQKSRKRKKSSQRKDKRKYIGERMLLSDGFEIAKKRAPSLSQYVDFNSISFVEYLTEVEEKIYKSQFLFAHEIYAILITYIQANAIPIDVYEFVPKDNIRVYLVLKESRKIMTLLNLKIDKQKYITNVFHRICSDLGLKDISINDILETSGWNGSIVCSILKRLHFKGMISLADVRVYYKKITGMRYNHSSPFDKKKKEEPEHEMQ